MVTWGSNTVHTFGGAGAAPVASGFGAAPAAPAGGSLFGAQSPAPAPGTTSLFGSPAPAPSTGSFGFGGSSLSPAPGASTGLLGSSPAQAPSTGFGFGSPSTSLFGAPAPAPGGGLFGSAATSNPAPAQYAPQQQIPAQAALQAHMNAAARQEADRVRAALDALNAVYNGTKAPTSPEDKSKFVCIVYNDMSPEERQMRWFQGVGTGGALMAPLKPPQVSEMEWKKAVANNPDPENYTPVALVGAIALQARVSWQQERAQELAKHVDKLQGAQEALQDRCSRVKQEVAHINRTHATLKKRLLDVMRKVELARCMNHPLQQDEQAAIGKLVHLKKQVEAARGSLLSLYDRAQSTAPSRPMQVTGMPDKDKLLPVLKEHREAIERMTNVAKHDLEDVSLIQKRVVPNVPLLTQR